MLSFVDPLQSTAPGVRAQPIAPARRASRLADLAEQVRQLQRRWHAPDTPCPTGLPPLDAALGGGLHSAAIHELIAAVEGTPALTLAFYLAAQIVQHFEGVPRRAGAVAADGAGHRPQPPVESARRRRSAPAGAAEVHDVSGTPSGCGARSSSVPRVSSAAADDTGGYNPASLRDENLESRSALTSRYQFARSGAPRGWPGFVETQAKIQNPKSAVFPQPRPPTPACKWIVCIDPSADLYPPGVAQLGVPLERLLVIRATHPADALWVAEQTLRCRAVAAVILPLRTLDPHTSRRLQLAAETGGGVGLLIRRTEPDAPTFAASRLRLEPVAAAGAEPRGARTISLCESLAGARGSAGQCEARLVRRPSASATAGTEPGRYLATAARGAGRYLATAARGAGRYLATAARGAGRYLRITVLKQRDGPPSDPFIVELPYAADSVPAHAAFCDGPPPPCSALGG